MATQQLTPAQRALLFAQNTRKYMQQLSTMTFAETSTVRQLLPKSRFLSKIYLRVEGTFVATHATKTTFGTKPFDKFNILKQVRITTNGAFSPYQVDGAMLRYYNLLGNAENESLGTDIHNNNKLANVVSSSGATNSICFTVELPLTLNERDTVGLMLLQSDSTNVTIEVDCGHLADMLNSTDSDVVLSGANIAITPIIDTFSVPVSNPNAIPDYSVIKIVNQQSESIVGNGDVTIKLPTSITYRKILLYIASDTYGTPIPLSNISSIQLIFNQADSPINIPLKHLSYLNARDYQNSLPDGCYVLDFSSQGIANMGGARDYIDAEKLTELWLKISFTGLSGNTNYINVVSEKLARLQ